MKSHLSELWVAESQFADDVSLYFFSRENFEVITESFVETTKDWGLRVGVDKTKGMVFGKDFGVGRDSLEPTSVGGGVVEMADKFVYLGSCISRDSGGGFQLY